MAQEKYLFETPFYCIDIGSLDALKELSDAELDEIIEDFRSGEKVSVMRKKYPYFNTTPFNSQLPYILSDKSCELCSGTVYYKLDRYPARRAYRDLETCMDCGHTSNINCSCESCMNEDKKIWEEYLSKKFSNPKDIEQISAYDEALLYFITEHYATDNLEHIKFPSPSKYSYGYNRSSSFPKEISHVIQNFIDRHILIPSKANNLHLIHKYELEGIHVEINYKTSKTNWDINLNRSGEKISIADFKELQKHKILSDAEKAMLWREIYLEEVSQYTAQQSSDFLNQDLDSIFYDYITDAMIGDYSLSQAFAQIYFAVIATMRYKTKYAPNKSHIHSYFRKKIMQNISNYDAKTCKNYNRPSYINSSIYNEFIIKNILKIQGDYFYSHTKEIIPSFKSNIIEDNIENVL